MKIKKTITVDEDIYEKFTWICGYNSIKASSWINNKIKSYVNEDENKVAIMIGWFRSQYENPAEHVSYDSREGGYQYNNGGPYDPEGELTDKFINYDEKLIEKAADELYAEGSEWVKKGQY